MCGIFGYIGKKTNAAHVVIEGLKRLDYRGYDSWGIAVNDGRTVHTKKDVGKISDITSLTNFPQASMGIAHTRWATTGAVTKINAHPHAARDNSFVLAQNGIVENYEELKEQLHKKGYPFLTETDTEVIVRLIEDKRKKIDDLLTAVRDAFLELAGRNTIILLTNDGQLIAARNGSPLVIGIDEKTNDLYFSSDTLSFAQYAQKLIVVDNGQIVHATDKGTLKIYDIKTNKEVLFAPEPINFTTGNIDKEGFDHYMLKEIHEAPFVIHQLLKQDEKPYHELAEALKKAEHVYTIGSGGAGVAASEVGYYLREFGKVSAVSLIGADATEYVDLFGKNDLIIAISQSGETADVLEVLEKAKAKGVKIASFINMPGSMITRMSDYKFMAEAGPEICVMSTKTFVSQIAFGYLLAKTLAGDLDEGKKHLASTADVINRYLADNKNHDDLKQLAKKFSKEEHIFLLGKSQNFHIIREGMVKIIEAAYIHAHALPAGDLKHYVITLMEKGVQVLALISNDPFQADMHNAVHQVQARGAEVTALAPENHESFDHYIHVPDTGETSSMMNLIPLQLLSYYMAVELDNNIDKPRNIAKSVTVK